MRVNTAERAAESGIAAQNLAPKIGEGLAAGVVQIKAQMKQPFQGFAE